MNAKLRNRPNFSHVSYASDYMHIALRKVVQHFEGKISGKQALDLPAGNGWIGEQLESMGASAVSADINEAQPTFEQVDMESQLPFEDDTFDIVICCEGIEHVFSPFHVFSELARVLKKGGILVITTPNIQNLYSRWQFLCTGYLFQFDPFDKTPLTKGMKGDKGHISPVSYGQLRYYSECCNLFVQPPDGGRMKRKILLLLLAPLLLIGAAWSLRDWKRTSGDQGRKEIINHLFNLRTLLSRSLVFTAIK